MVEAIRDPTNCPSCGITATGKTAILTFFGFRTMQDGVIREQSWCRKCRSGSKTFGELEMDFGEVPFQ